MSASKDKLTRKQQIEAGTDKRSIAQAKEKAQRRKSAITYSVVAVVLVVFFAFVLIYNSSWPSRHTTAVEINGQKYTVAQLDYYYSASYMTFYNNYGQYINYGMFFDPNTSLAKQEYGEGTTWRQYFLDSAVQDMAQIQMLNEQAEANGFTLPEEDQASYDEEIESLQTAWQDLGYSSLQQYLNMNYGKGVDLELLKQELYRTYVASAYSRSVYDGYDYTTAELDDWYAENADDLDVIDYAYYTVTKPDETAEDSSTDADEPTDAEAVESDETETEESADTLDMQVAAEALNGTDEQAFADYLAENVGEGTEPVSTSLPGASLSADYSQWLLDSARQAGDVTAIDTDSASYLVMFLGRNDNSYPMAGFRHILIQAEDSDGDGVSTDEEIQAAADEAQSIYDEWQAGDATEDSFAALANERSQDEGSNTTGGLYEDVYQGAMVEPINDWLFQPGRKAGDTTVVSYEGSYTGTHVLYYTGQSELTYAQYQADTSLRNEAYDAWQEEQMAAYEPVTSHMSMAGKLH